MQFALFIFLNRKWEYDKLEITKFIEYYKEAGKNIWVQKIFNIKIIKIQIEEIA